MEDHGPLEQVDPEIAELLRQSESWPPEMKARAARRVKEKVEKQLRVWYCNRGRECDGKPHEGADYPHARGKQWPPEDNDYLTWFIRSGRGFGKTRTAAEWVRYITKYVGRIAMVGRRGTDVRLTMVEGESGLEAVCLNAGVPYTWRPSTREFIFEENGARVYGFSGEEPDSLRGPQFGAGWIDEPAHMPLIQDVWDNLLFGLRIPGLPGGAKVLLTGTPIPTDFIRERSEDKRTRLVLGSTYDNLDNLDPTMRQMILDTYEGTRKGEQELYGQILVEVEGSLWKVDMIQYSAVIPEDMDRIVISVDPAGSTNKRSDDTGIVVCGVQGRNGYLLHDGTGKHSPANWARIAVELYRDFKADAIVAENNFGGQMVKSTIENYLQSVGEEARIIVTNASRSKELRAEPIVGLYEQGRIFHQRGLAKVEEEMLGWVPGKGRSPNRVDALVHGFTELMKPTRPGSFASPRRGSLIPKPTLPGTKRSMKRSIGA